MKNNQIQKFFVAAALVLGFAACAEDVDTNKNNENDGTQANITVSIRQGWDDDDATRAARAAQSSFAGETQVITAEGTIGGQPVYLWCREMDGIQTSNKTTAADEAEATRGVLMNGDTGMGAGDDKSQFHSSFLIFGDGVQDGTEANNPDQSKNVWNLSKSITWPDTDKTFYGLAPADGTYTAPSATGFTYTTPALATNQPDIMVGAATGSKATKKLHFQFQHVMSAIKFKIGNSGFNAKYKIKKIELRNIHTKGTFSFSDSKWSALSVKSGKNSIYQEFDFSTDKYNVMITSDTEGSTFLVLPQVLPDNAQAVISIVDTTINKSSMIAATIGKDNNENLTNKNPEWKAGHTYTYVISSSQLNNDEYILDVEENPTFDYEGNAASAGSNIFKVTSYKKSDNSAVPWTAIGYKLENEDGTYPNEWSPTETTMLANTGFSGNGGMVAEEKTVSVKKQNATEEVRWRRENILRARTEKQNLDLSLCKVDNETLWPGGRNTANCYIVRQGGTYKIPLVIGNTIRNGSRWIPSDYMTTSIGSRTYNNGTNSATCYYGYEMFKDYSGAVVTSTNYRITNATTAEIVWHDFREMDNNSNTGLDVITNPAVTTTADTDGLHYLTFSVDKDKIQQGNAVLAVKDNAGDIIWSWHIYITDTDWTNSQVTLTNYQGDEYKISTENLGYVEGGQRLQTYKARKMKVLLEQNISGKRAEVTITQNGLPTTVVEIINQWDTKYQWARKDAFPGTDKYFTEGQSIQIGSSLPDNHYESIKKPTTLWINSAYGNWYGNNGNNIFINGWSAENQVVATNDATALSATAIYKTIYDPCPAGFTVPLPRTFTGITTTGGEVTGVNVQANRDKVNAKGEWALGWNFYCYGKNGASIDEKEASGTVFFAATGLINSGTSVAKPRVQGLSWSAIPRMNQSSSSRFTAVNMSYEWNPDPTSNTYNVRPMANNGQRSALPVRPVAEDDSPANINHGVDVGNYGNGGTGNLDLQ